MYSTDNQVGVEPAGADRDEPVYQSARTWITRRRSPGAAPVLVKEPRGPGAGQRLHHEHAMLRRLAGVKGVQQLAAGTPADGALVLVDAGGVSLAQLVGGTVGSTAALVELARDVTGIIGTVHRYGVVHRDVNPANIVVDQRTYRPTLIDFDLATTSVHERPGFTATTEIAGTLPYIAPEQTGRTGWPVDHRVDLYSLGATLYELATGAPPFGRGDALDLIRGHLTTRPRLAGELNPDLPAALSEIVDKLLEKEPDRRYQTAEGLLHDLDRLRERLAAGRPEPFPLGERDFPVRLTPPARPVGRDAEIAALAGAFAAAAGSDGGAVLVTGPPGVGKTTVIDQLRPLVTTRDGWFVTGKFDEHRRDRAADGVWRALRALGRLLLAESDDALAAHRARLRERLGPNAGLIAAVVPELAVLLAVEPEPLAAAAAGPDGEGRLVQAAVDVVTTVAAAGRPLVLVVDDLQWAGATAVGVVDALVTGRPGGVLLVGAYRDAEVDAVHPLSARLSRWERSPAPPLALRLRNLPPDDVQALLADMLRLRRGDAGSLAVAVGARTHGNPFDTVALVNALRRDGALTPTADGWAWDAATIARHVGSGDVVDLLTARIDDLPEPTRALLEVLSCLGDRTEFGLLGTATGMSAAELEERLTPALEEGLLVLETGAGPAAGQGVEHAVTFRHDRVRQAAYAAHGNVPRVVLHRDLARRLAAREDLRSLAAEQYVAAVTELADPAERVFAAGLLRTAAVEARLTDPALAERYLAAASALLRRTDRTAVADPAGRDAALAAVRIEHHAALCGLGRFGEADDVYAEIERQESTPLELVAVALPRIAGLRARNRQPEALALGLDLLTLLGMPAPAPDDLMAEIDRGIEELGGWTASGSAADDLDRPEVTDPAVLAAAKVLDQILPVAYFSGQPVFAWLVAQARRMWAQHGPCADLVPPLSHAGFMTIMLRQDHRTGYEATRRVLAVSEARGYEPQTSHARFLFSLAHGPWFEPVPEQLELARRAREGFQTHGVGLAALTYFASIPLLLDCAPTVEAFNAEAEAGVAAARRIGDAHTAAAFVGYGQLARALRGDAPDVAGPDVETTGPEANPTAAANAHTAAAVTAAILADPAELVAHAAAAFPLLPFVNATYLAATTHLVRALGLIEELRAGREETRAGTRAALGACRDWLAGRAADAPENFGHLLELVDAETRWVDGDEWGAASGFDTALREAARRRRPWHHALIAERAGRFYLARGLPGVARGLLAQARDGYAAWGAAAKVAQLDRAYPDLPGVTGDPAPAPRAVTTTNVTTGALDVMAVLDASRALGSATTLDALRSRLAEVLGAMTGATDVRLLMWDAGAREWALRAAGEVDDAPVLLRGPGADGHVPLSVVRYVQRTAEPLLVADGTADDRFARDPYLRGMDGCSIMAVPILSRGVPRALLLLEKPGSRGAFTADRLDAVALVAGQLAVSIENAVVYASLERQVSQRTQALAAANEQLELLNRTDPLTGLANRRQMEEVLAGEWALSQATNSPISVVMVDVDHFKQYNDHYGHLGGDQCLRRVADALSVSTRGTDLLARYGGEEFCLILPGADLETGERIAERARLSVAVLQAEHARSPLGFVTVSLGLACVVPDDDLSPEDVVRWADEGLYEAKRNGRNRVGVCTGSPTS